MHERIQNINTKIDTPKSENKEKIDLAIEIAKEDEWEDCKKIKLESLEKEPMAFWATKESIERENNKSETDWKKELTDPYSFVVLAKDNKILVGMSQANLNGTKGEGQWGIRGVYLNKDFRGNHSGLKMMNLILDEIKNRGGKTAYLNVIDTQIEAKKMYDKLGFKVYEKFPSKGVGLPAGQWMKKEI